MKNLIVALAVGALSAGTFYLLRPLFLRVLEGGNDPMSDHRRKQIEKDLNQVNSWEES